jgi:hypothetical protein
MRSPFVCFGLVGAFLAVASCTPPVPEPQAGGGIGGTGSVSTVGSGPVTKFGSVFISGTEYDNSKTIYCIDDEPCGLENKLKIGMVVLVNGKVTEEYATNQPIARVADTITYEETVEGAVQWVAPDGSSLVVLGQVVSVNQKTIIDDSIPGRSITALTDQDIVEISGFVTGDGTILATLISKQTGTPHYEVQGAIENHDPKAKTFTIGSLTVTYASADIDNMPSAQWDKIVVHVRGDQWSAGGSGPNGARLTATKVRRLSLGVEDIDEAEVEGFILRTDAPGDFYVNNLHVQATGATVFEGGTLTDLIVGAHVKIHGRLTNGILQAEHIAFAGNLEVESNVTSIDLTARTFTLAGLSGLTVRVDERTAIDGEGDLHRLDDLRIGDHLKIHGRLIGTFLNAKELERSGPSAGIKIEAPVQSAQDPVLIMAGATIDTAGISDSGFIGRYGAIGRTAFFRGLVPGQKVSLKGTWTGSAAAWTSARLKD